MKHKMSYKTRDILSCFCSYTGITNTAISLSFNVTIPYVNELRRRWHHIFYEMYRIEMASMKVPGKRYPKPSSTTALLKISNDYNMPWWAVDYLIYYKPQRGGRRCKR